MSEEKIRDYDQAPTNKMQEKLYELGKEKRPIKIMFAKIPLSLKAIKGGLMKLRKFLGFNMILVLLFSFACSGKTQDTTLKAYTSAGIMLENIHKTSAALCDAKYISGKTCNKMTGVYSKAKITHYQLGETSIVVANAAKTIQEQLAACRATGIAKCDITNFNLVYQSALELYQKQYKEAEVLVNELIKLSSEFKAGGAK